MTLTLDQAITGFMDRVCTVLTSNRQGAQHLLHIWGGWEKWLQGEIILALQGAPIRISQEDSVYRGSSQLTADFVLQLREGPKGGAGQVPDTCIVELKAVSINQSTAEFRNKVRDDITKMAGRLQVATTNPDQVGRLMVAVSVPAKPLNDTWLDAQKTYVTGRTVGGTGFEAKQVAAGGFSVYGIRWLAPA